MQVTVAETQQQQALQDSQEQVSSVIMIGSFYWELLISANKFSSYFY